MYTLRQRPKIIGPGLVIGSLLALCLAAWLLPPNFGFQGRELMWTWVAIMGGPVLGTSEIFGPFPWITGLGYLGLLLIPAHPTRPHGATGLVTVIGFLLWFLAGFYTALVGLYGA
jgi:hypothetical protein